MEVTVVGPAECGGAEAFVARLQERLPAARSRAGDEPTWRADVLFSVSQAGVRGQLSVWPRSGGERVVRTLEGAACPEVRDGLVLAFSLIVDPSALLDVPPEPPSPPEPPPVKPPPAPQPPPARRAPDTSPAPAPDEVSRALVIELSALGAVFVGLAPPVALGTGVQLAFEPRTDEWVSLRATLAVRYAQSLEVEGDAGTGLFRWLWLRVGAAPIRVPVQPWLELRPTVGVDGGAILVEGLAVPVPESDAGAWFAADVALEARLLPTPDLVLGLSGGALVPVTRPRIVVVDPRSVLFAVPPVIADLAVSVGYRFEL